MKNHQKVAIVALVIFNLGSTTAYSPPAYAPLSTRRNDQVLISSTERHISDIRYVEWAGCKGLLPLQNYKNPMELQGFAGWMRKPMPIHWENHVAKEMPEGISDDTNSFKRNRLTAAHEASMPLDPRIHLQPLYVDAHLVVVHKESGALSVPGPVRHPSVAGLVHEYFGNEEDDVDKMIVHRLDMHTSGVICYARTKEALSTLHDAFRKKSGVGLGDETIYKKYEALVCGHVKVSEGEIDLPLMRDRNHLPFMKVGIDLEDDFDDVNDTVIKPKGYMKMMAKPPKESLSLFRVLALEMMNGIPVTRLELVPITGRTHQLRVHCAAIGHPIIGDNIYGYNGDGSPYGGLSNDATKQFTHAASKTIQEELFNFVQESRMNHELGEYNGDLCLHAKQLTLMHPISKAPMSFEKDSPF